MKKKVVLKNGLMGIISQVSKIFFTFFTRTLFIKYIGTELLGLNSTFTSILGTLAVTELGFQTAVAFSLYKPLHDENKKEVNDIMNIFKMVYRFIGIIFVLASFILLPFLKYIITGIEVTPKVWLFFLLQSAASTCTYFLAYKRTILYADQRDYIAKLIDMITNIVFNILQCISLAVFKNYILFLILKIIQVYLSNILIHFYCNKYYPYLHKDRINKQIFKEILIKVRDVFAGRIAGYIYASTDNIVISAFVSTISVGFLVNYTTITQSLKTLKISLLNPLTPIIGHYLVENESRQGRTQLFYLYAHVMYFLAVCTVIPLMVLVDDFIAMWVGPDMIMSRVTVFLLAADLYVHLVHGCLTEFINGAGLFHDDRNIEVAGALTNIITSLILVQFIGISGVLIGTVTSQILFWVGRSRIVFKKCLFQDQREFVRYWTRNAAYLFLLLIMYLVCNLIYSILPISNKLFRFVFGGVLCEVVLIAAVCLVCGWMPEQKKLVSIAEKTIKKKLRLNK